MKKKAPLYKGSWPAGPEGLSSPLQETRKKSLAKANCNIASWMRHWRPPPQAGGNFIAANRMQSIRGKRKNKRWENTFSQPLFLSFSLCPWCCFFSQLHATCGNKSVRYDCMSQNGSRANGPGVGYRGREAPCSR